MRGFLSAALLLATAGCTHWPAAWTPYWMTPPGQLTLSNFRFTMVSVQAVMATGPFCAPADLAARTTTAFKLPFKGTHVLEAAPNADICWRRQLADGRWSEWNRALTGTGKYVDAQL